MSLQSHQLEAFVEIVKHKTVHKAAASLHLTQTAITQRIRALESKLRVTLFIRRRTGMNLTPEGEALLYYCQATKDLETKALAKIYGSGVIENIELTITGPSSLMSTRIAPACATVMKKFPKLLIDFNVDDIEQRHKLLKTGKCDFAIVQKEQLTSDFSYKLLAPEQYVLVCSKSWQNRSLENILQHERIIDFDTSDQMTFNYLKNYGLLEYVLPERYFVNRTDILASLVIAGLGYGVLTLEFAKPYIEKKQLMVLNKGEIYDNLCTLAWYKRPNPPNYFSAIIAEIA